MFSILFLDKQKKSVKLEFKKVRIDKFKMRSKKIRLEWRTIKIILVITGHYSDNPILDCQKKGKFS